MLSSFPTELLREIIERSVPHTYHSATYQDRQDTLRSLCLVSHRFRHIAQPLIFEIAALDPRQIEGFIRHQPISHTKALILPDPSGIVEQATFEEVLRGCGNLQSLVLHRSDKCPLDLSALSRCPNLVELQLSGGGFDTTRCTRFEALQSLTLSDAVLLKPLPLLDPAVLPSLRTLGLRSSTNRSQLANLRTTRIAQLLPQLDAIAVELNFFRLAQDNLLARYKARTMVNMRQTDLHPSLAPVLSEIHHFRLEAPELEILGQSEKSRVLARFSVIIAAARSSEPNNLESIYLDSTFRPSAADSPNDYSRQFAQLEEECAEVGINLVLKEHQGQIWLDPWLSKEFSRRQRKAREAGQIQEVDGN